MDPCAILCCYLIALILTVDANPRNFERNGKRKRTVTDPVSNFLSELGELFLDIDQTVAVQTAPKVSYEDRIAAQIFRPLNQPLREQFDRTRKNYRTLQQRLGSLIDRSLTPLTQSLSTDSRETDPKLKNLFQIAFPPLKPQTNDHRKISAEEQNSKISTIGYDNLKSSLGVNSADLGTTEENRQDSSGNTLQTSVGRVLNQLQTVNDEEQVRRTVQKMISDAKRTNEYLNSMSSKALDDLSNVLVRRMGDVPEDSKPQERIIGDLLDSENRFDKYVRQLLQTHGRWVLDSPLLNLWRESSKTSPEEVTKATTSEVTSEETSTEPLMKRSESTVVQSTSSSTEAYITSPEFQTEVIEPAKVFKDLPAPQSLSSSYYRVDDGRKTEEEIDIVLSSDPEEEIKVVLSSDTVEEEMEDGESEEIGTEAEEIEAEENEVEEKGKDTVILAFTPDGIPLKLRMGPEIENPIGYLHKVLRSAGVSLKVPVESYEDIEPVGKEVLLLGAGADITRSVYIDVSNRNELKSLLRTLMKKSKSSERL